MAVRLLEAKKIIKGATKGPYVIIKELKENVYKLQNITTKQICIMKIILDVKHPLWSMGVTKPSERSLFFHQLLAERNLSPKVLEYFKLRPINAVAGPSTQSGVVLILEYISGAMTEENTEDPIVCDAIDQAIERLHSMGLVHGDLHSMNIRLRRGYIIKMPTAEVTDFIEVYLIDLDAVFLMWEYESTTFVKEWITRNFDLPTGGSSLEEFIEYERTQYRTFADVDS